jgi:superfamily II DNA or RNA helicase
LTTAQQDAEWRSLKSAYRTGPDSLGTVFFKPCIRSCVQYRRAAGFFSSSALLAWAEALRDANLQDVVIELLISPELSTADRVAFTNATSDQERVVVLSRSGDELIAEVLSKPDDVSSRRNLFVWLVASGRLKIQFALPKHAAQVGIFHQKTGLFSFEDGSKVAFDGSANETASGYERNYESVQVFRSWVDGDRERLAFVEAELERQWSGQDEFLLVVPLSRHSLELIRTRHDESTGAAGTPSPPTPDPRWAHQIAAADAFIAARRGVLEMATGTGKTKTALQIATRLLREGQIESVILATEGTDLLSQWCDEFLDWRSSSLDFPFALYRHFGSAHQGMSFALRPASSVLVVSRTQLSKFLPTLTPLQAQRTLVIHDEVHGIGAPSTRLALRGMHARYGYVLGLSATPEREYDAEGSAFLETEIGQVVFQFGLEDAIRRRILVEFDYVPLPYQLTADDRARLKAVYSRKAAREKSGSPMSQEELWTELARVYKTAQEKPQVFADYLQRDPGVVRGCLVFVEERAYGERILPMLHELDVRYRTYYAEDDRENLLMFGRGEIDCVITCHKVSQGIDIRSLRAVVLFSSARARLETIQRIGRCLRSDPANPEKRAVVVDFVLEAEEDNGRDSADAARCAWLEELSRVRRM